MVFFIIGSRGVVEFVEFIEFIEFVGFIGFVGLVGLPVPAMCSKP